MKRLNKTYLLLMVLGTLLLLSSILFQHYIHFPNLISGILKGSAVGFMLLGSLLLSKEYFEQT